MDNIVQVERPLTVVGEPTLVEVRSVFATRAAAVGGCLLEGNNVAAGMVPVTGIDVPWLIFVVAALDWGVTSLVA